MQIEFDNSKHKNKPHFNQSLFDLSDRLYETNQLSNYFIVID